MDFEYGVNCLSSQVQIHQLLCMLEWCLHANKGNNQD